jgi:hypothetical protein
MFLNALCFHLTKGLPNPKVALFLSFITIMTMFCPKLCYLTERLLKGCLLLLLLSSFLEITCMNLLLIIIIIIKGHEIFNLSYILCWSS